MKLARLLDIIVPRFMTEDAAVQIHHCGHCSEPHYQPICSMVDIDPGEVFDGIVTMRFFNFFGMTLFARFDVDNVRPWVNPHDAKVFD